MNYERFKRAVMEQILDHLPDGREGWTVKMEQVRKVNRLLDGMVLIPPKEWEARHGVGITFYMEDYYTLFRKGMPLEQILEQIGQMTLNCAPPDTLKEAFFHPERMKHQIVMELVHRERNQTLLEDLPHRDFLDLAVIYRILMKDEERGYFCTTISYNMMKLLEMTEEALYQAACLYMPSELPFGVRNFDGKFIILSNSSQMFGASALLFPDVLDMACEALGGDVYILPASGDKICLEIANPQRLEELQKMVWDFYHMGNDPEDMLSDQIYFYRMHSGQVQITEQAARVAEGRWRVMISYERFRQEVMNRILSYLPESYGDWKVRMETEYKVNQTLDCLTLFPPEQRKLIAVPKFYMQEYYKMFLKGASADYILRMIASRIENAPSPEAVEASGFDLLQFQNDVVLQLVNRFRNHVFLKSVPHRPFLDLAVIYRILVFDPNGVWSGAIVNYSMLNAMGITEEELFERAYKHTPQALPFRLADTGEILMVTNDSEQFGAAAMLYPEQLNAACEKLGGSIYIFPGSMHELYIVREEPAKLDFYRQMVACANSDVVDETEWLSGQVYRYNQKQGR